LLFSDIPNNRIMRWTPETGISTYRSPSNYANGHTRDRKGRLISCEHGTRRVTRTEPDGTITMIADSYDGKPLNSPKRCHRQIRWYDLVFRSALRDHDEL
jgi:gluconolactonase